MSNRNFFSDTSETTTVSFGGKYLSVLLGSESYALSVLRVREIIRLQKITPLPQMPAYVRGVVDLRGRVVPVVDLRLRFGIDAEMAERTCIVVAHVTLASRREILMGFVVDGVEEVATISEDQVEPAPHWGTKVKSDYLHGIAKVKGSVKMLLDVDRVINDQAAEAVARVL